MKSRRLIVIVACSVFGISPHSATARATGVRHASRQLTTGEETTTSVSNPSPIPTSETRPSPILLRITTLPGSRVSLGWTGISHNQSWVENALIAVTLNDCDPTGPDFDCRVNGFSLVGQQFGPPVPMATGGLPVCIVNTISKPLAGTVNLATGCGALSLHLISSVHTGQSIFKPCPLCQNDHLINDGAKEGKCDSGPSQGQPCDVNGTTSIFGPTSKDCLPDPGANVGDLEIVMNPLSSGPFTVNATAGNNSSCLGTDRSSGKHFVGCLCPAQIKPNQCDDMTCSTTGQCLAGPVDMLCDGTPFPFAGCSRPGTTRNCEDSNPGLGTCRSFARPCFQPVLTRTGVCGTRRGRLAAFFCVPRTTSGAVNLTSGLPGPGLLELNISFEVIAGAPLLNTSRVTSQGR